MSYLEDDFEEAAREIAQKIREVKNTLKEIKLLAIKHDIAMSLDLSFQNSGDKYLDGEESWDSSAAYC